MTIYQWDDGSEGRTSMRSENPFTLTFGKEPHTAITRYEDLNTIIDTFQSENPLLL